MDEIQKHRPVRLTHDASYLARVIIGEGHSDFSDESIDNWGEWFGVNQRDRAVLKDAIRRAGPDGVRQLSHFDG